MADFRNKNARVLDVQTWKEVREIVLSNGERIELKQIEGHYVVDAEVANTYRLHKDPRYSLRCTGTAFVVNKGRCQCNAELYPYKILVDGESRHYLRANKKHDDGKDGMVGKEGLCKGHLRLCPFGFEADSKISKEWSYCYEVKESSMMDSIEECRNLHLKKTTRNGAENGNDSSGRGEKAEKGDRGSENKPVEETIFVTEEKKTEPKSAMDFWASSVNLSGDIKIIGKNVMTHRNYISLREGNGNLNGAMTLMAGLSPSYKDYKELIIEQHKDLAKLFGDQTLGQLIDYYTEQIKKYVDSKSYIKVNELRKKKKDLIERTKNKIVILEDPFLGGDSIIIVLIDKLSPEGGWRHLTRRKIDADTLMDFVVGGYSWEDVKDENGKKKKQKVFHNATAPFFPVMCNWEERILTVDGKNRKMVVGSVYALGRQIDYFLENDLSICKSKLRFTGYKNYQVK